MKLYRKPNTGTNEINPKKHTISEDMVIGLAQTLNSSNLEDCKIGLNIMKNSNVNEFYGQVFDNLDKTWHHTYGLYVKGWNDIIDVGFDDIYP